MGRIGDEFAEVLPSVEWSSLQSSKTSIVTGRGEKHRHLLRRWRPLNRISPLIASHHEVAHWLFAIHSVIDAFEIVIHPTKNDIIVFNRRSRAKLTFS